MPDPAPRLPARPSLEQLRKQAKELLRDLRSGAPAAERRFRAVHPRFSGPADPADATLADAQLVLAREHGFESWPSLVHHVETVHPRELRELESLAGEIAAAYTSGDFAAIREINWTYGTSYAWDREPARMQERLPTWFASENRTMELALADARHLVAKQSGCDGWDELVRRLARPSTGAGSGRGAPPSTLPFYRIDREASTIETRGPVSDRDWDTVFAAMKEERLTGLRAGGQMTDAALQRLARLDHVTRLDLGGSRQVTDDGLRHVASLSRLQELDVGGWDGQVTDRGLEVLRHLPELRTFHMAWQQRVTDAGLAALAGCEPLESVDLMGTRTGDGALAALAGRRRLRRVKAGTRVGEAGLAALHDVPAFRSWQGGEPSYTLMGAEAGPTFLLLPQRPFATGGLGALAGLDGLFGLSLFTMGESGGRAITAAGIRPLAGLASLGWLGCDPADGAMAEIAALPRLRMLSCQDTRAGDDDFAALARSRSLEYIWGRATPNLGARGLAALAAMPSLRGLATSLEHVDDAGLSVLPGFPALRELMPMGLRDGAFRHVGRCERLEALWMMYCRDTGDRATEHVSRLPALKTYYAGSTRITDRSLELLGTMETLEEVSLWHCVRVTDAGLAALARLPRLRKVTLEGLPGVSRAGAGAFGPAVRVSYGG